MPIRVLGLRLCVCVLVGLVPLRAAANTVAGGGGHTVVVKPDGTLWTWGDNTSGQLGDGTTTARRVPGAVPTITDAVVVAAGFSHTLVLRSNGSVWSFGYNWYGQLGDNSTTNRADPVPVVGLANVVAIAAGQYHSVALTSDGRVWTWGSNSNGRLGDGTTTDAKQPALVTTLTSITAIGAGGSHTLAVKSDGTAWAWGLNSSGQLGDSSFTQRTAPVQLPGVTGAIAVTGGAYHSLILKSDGTVRAAGDNTFGEIGDNSTSHRPTAVAVSGLTNVAEVAANSGSSYARKTDGSIWAWGANFNGQLGDGTLTIRYIATQLTGANSIGTIGAGRSHAVAVTTGGVVLTWGYNVNGQLGDGTTQDRWTPVGISGPNYDWKVSTPVFSVASGTYTTEKTVVVTAATPEAIIHYTIDGADPTEADASVVSGGSIQINQTRTVKGRAFKTGMPASNIAVAAYTLSVANITFSPVPTTYATPQTVTLSTTSPGAAIRYTLDGSTPSESSALYTGPLSVNTTTTIKAIGLRASWTASAVATGTYTMNFGTLAAPGFSPTPGTLDNDVTVTLTAMPGATIRYTTGASSVTPSSPIYSAPLPVTATTTINARAYHPDYTTSAQSSGTYTLVVATPTLSHLSGTYPAGQVVTASSTTQGAVLRYTLNGGAPTVNDPVVPPTGIVLGNFTVKVAAWKTGNTASGVATGTFQVTGTLTPPRIAAGDTHTLAVRDDGSVWAWGGNSSRQLGDGTTTQRSLPILVNVSGAVDVAGSAHSLALGNDGTVYAWGSNSHGQLADGTTTTRGYPALIAGLSGLGAVTAGGSHTLVLKNDGTVWGIGKNSEGQLGDATTTQRLTAVQASGLSSITAVSAGSNYSLALRADNTLWAWGTNSSGQLGLGDTTTRLTPTQVPGISPLSISAGSDHNLVLLADGTVRAWGQNDFGELGDGTISQRTAPVAVSSLTSITAAAAGGDHSLALDNSGRVWAWGLNSSGQLGDATTTNRTVPALVQGLPVVMAIAAGHNHSFALDAGGGVWTWGNNSYGRLGDGTTTNRTTPVQIADAGMMWKIPAPVLSLASGLYMTEQSVTVTSGDPDAVLHYTITGANPTESDPTVASGGSIAIPQSLTLKVRAWKQGALASEVAIGTYELKAIAPVLSPGTGAYGSAQTVGITTVTSGATIRYTTDGSEPTDTSTTYAGTVTEPIRGR